MTSLSASGASNHTATNLSNARTNISGARNNFNIKWENFNYPPYIKLIHYDLNEIEEPTTKLTVRLVNLIFLLNLIVSAINFINSIAQTAAGHNGLRILFSVLNFFIFVPITFFTFYKGYRGLVYNRIELRYSYAGSAICMIAFMVFSIISGGNYNGWTRASYLFSEGDIFQGILAIFESLIYLTNSVLCAYCIYRVSRSQNNASEDDRL